MDEQGRLWDTGRVEAFSDGVFAIAITLLVLEIRVEPEDFDRLGRALAHEWPAYLAYVTSFLTVGSVWIAHHGLLTRLRWIDPMLVRLNLLLLMAAAFLPFPTAVLAQAIQASDEAERTAVVFYGAAALVIELLLRAVIRYALSKPDLAIDPEGARRVAAQTGGWRTLVISMAYGIAILFAVFALPRLAAVGYLLVAVRGVFVVGGEGRLSLRPFGRARRERRQGSS